MQVRRGDVVLALYPFAAARGGSRRPALVVQNDRDDERLHNTIT
jgi:mRNA-degrading endonuclease toxin of MazEF toxin-antitoxin module